MADYYNRHSDRACHGQPVRLTRTYRLHPDRLADLDKIARAWCMTKARAIETMIKTEADLIPGDGTHPTPAAFTYTAEREAARSTSDEYAAKKGNPK